MAVALLLLCLIRPAAWSQDLLTLDQAVSLALANNRTLKTAALEVQKSDDRIAATSTRRLPQFSFMMLGGQLLTRPGITLERGILGDYAGVGPIPGATSTLNAPRGPAAFLLAQATLPLSQQYKIGLNLRQLAIQKDAAKQQLRSGQADIVASVRKAYYGLLRTQTELDAAQQTIRLYQEVERITVRYVQLQTVQPGDLMDAQAQLARSEYQATVLRNQLTTEKEELNRLIGRSLDTDFRVNPLIEAEWTPLDVAALQERALAQNPQVLQTRLSLASAQLDTRIKKSEWIPDVGLTAGYISAPGLGPVIPRNIAAAGVLVSWEPFDWGRKRSELAEKAKSEQQAALKLQESEDDIRLAVSRQARKVLEARQLLTVCRKSQEHAEEQVRVARIRYSQSASLLRTVLEAQTAVAAARGETQKALTAFSVAVADLDRITGGN
jgi:outer membrane protein TolC